jgi:4-diphosphocytidyl-2C-methyl-D-erythritol kinase
MEYNLRTEAFLNYWNNYDIKKASSYMFNVLESVSSKKKPEIGIIKTKMIEYGALNALMSGKRAYCIWHLPGERNSLAGIFEV